MRHALDDGWAPNATFVLKTLAAVAWLAWFQIVAALADVISGLARVHAEGDPDRAGAIWERGAVAIGWGASDSRS